MRVKKEVWIIVCVIVVLLAAIIALSAISNKPQEPDEVVNKAPVQIINAEAPVKNFSVTNADGSYSVTYVGGMWYSPENVNAYLNREYVENLFKTACTLSAIPVEENAADLAKYGLDYPASLFEFKDESGKTYTIKFGAQSPTQSGYYTAVNDEKNVYIVSADNYNLLCGGINSLRNKNILAINSDEVYRITIKNKKNTITIQPKTDSDVNTHSSTAWEMVTPYKRDVNQYIFEENVIKTLDFTVSEFIDDNPSDYSVYGLDNPAYTITVDSYEGSYTIMLGNDKDENLIYMQIKGLPNVYSINRDLVKYRDFTPIYLMESLVFSRMLNCVDTIEFNAESSYVMKIDGTDFYVNGNTVDEELFREAYRVLISPVISGEVEDAAGNEICRFTFNYNTNTPSETVAFYEYGEMYAAVKVNGSMEFYVKRSYVDDMIDAVNKLAE